jgi:RNA polymerase sigma factor (TIGR02999 family)
LCLQRLRDGDRGAADEMLPLVCEQLRALAGRLMRGDRPGHTLQPTALVHEAWFKVARALDGGGGPRDREHFLAVATKAMRQVLVNHARDRRAAKRGAGAARVPLDDVVDAMEATTGDLAGWNDLIERTFVLAAGLDGDARERACGASARATPRCAARSKPCCTTTPTPRSSARRSSRACAPRCTTRCRRRIGAFRILGVLGRGGIGVVYRAMQDQPAPEVALEALAPGSRSMAIPNHTVFLGYPLKGAERGDGTGLQHVRLRRLERLVDDDRQPTVVRRRRS